MNTIAVAINLPTNGTPQQYLAALQQAADDLARRGDYTGTQAVVGLIKLVEQGFQNVPFLFPGR